MISFFKDTFASGTFKRLFKNTGLLISGDTVSAVLGVLTFAVTARALGTEKLGMLVLIDAYVRIVDKLINFQSWQFMIKYGSDALSAKDPSGFKALVKLGTIVDGFTALIGCAASLAGAGLIARWQNWSPEMTHLAMIYSLIVLFDIAGVPTGLLRIFDKFKSFSVQKCVTSGIKFVGVLIAWAFHGGLSGFLWVWMLTEIVDYVSLTAMAWVELHRRGFKDIWAEPLSGITKRFPGVWNFLISTNLTGSVKVGFREFDILLVGKLLGFADVSLYKLAKKLCAALDRLTNPLFQSLYPELTKLWAKKDFKEFRHVVKRMTYLMGGVSVITWIVFVIWGHEIIFITTGREFITAYSVTVWYMLANAIAVTSLPLAPMILAMGQAHLSFWIQFLPTLIYFPVLYWMLTAWGLNGAGYAYIVYHGIRVLLQYGIAKQLLKKTPRDTLRSPPEVMGLQENGV
ncbi:MAG: lipopolysaccharide biosynthesis protein [Candidatus Omnitrophota bacterium]